jgi:hypothetical protein
MGSIKVGLTPNTHPVLMLTTSNPPQMPSWRAQELAFETRPLTHILLTSTKWWAPASASKWRLGFNSAFKGLIHHYHWLPCLYKRFIINTH